MLIRPPAPQSSSQPSLSNTTLHFKQVNWPLSAFDVRPTVLAGLFISLCTDSRRESMSSHHCESMFFIHHIHNGVWIQIVHLEPPLLQNPGSSHHLSPAQVDHLGSRAEFSVCIPGVQGNTDQCERCRWVSEMSNDCQKEAHCQRGYRNKLRASGTFSLPEEGKMCSWERFILEFLYRFNMKYSKQDH